MIDVSTAFEETNGRRARVAVLDDYQDAARTSADFGPLQERADVVVFHDHVADESDLAVRLAGFDAVIVMRERTPFPDSLLTRLPDLKLLVTTGPANAAIDIGAAKARGVTVSCTGYAGRSAGEMTWALVMALVRHVPAEDASVRAGHWQTTVGRELAGSTLGLLGLGNLGRQVAGYGRAFGMTVIAWSENLTAEKAAQSGVEAVSKDELFERADIVSVHVRQSERTIGIVGAPELRRLGPDGLLVNTSRGPVVDEAALVAALNEGWIAGAALDVFDVEPLPLDHPLRRAPNTVLTPHIGYVARGLYAVFYRDAVDNVLQWLDGVIVRELQTP